MNLATPYDRIGTRSFCNRVDILITHRLLRARITALALSLLCLVLLLPLSAHAQANQPIYTGSATALAGAWQNWSWCTTNLGATNFVYPGDSYSAQITYTAGNQGFYVESTGFNTNLYTNLTFQINGGSTGGQQIAVYGLVNGVQGTPVSLDNYVTGGSVVAGAWKQVTIPLADLGIANTANVDGFWLFEPTGSAQPAFYVDNMTLTAATPPTSVSLAVNAGSIVRTMDARIFGANTAIWDSDLDTTDTISLLSASSTQILRFPGGSTADTYNWQTNITVGDANPWSTTFDNFAAVVTGLKAQAFVTANYGSGTAQQAAAWVTYSNVTNKYGLKYWEIGNEVYGSWEYDTHAIVHDPYTYAVQVKAYIAAMKAVDPTIKIGVVGITGEDSFANNTNHPATNPVTGVVHNGWTPVMLATLKSLGVTPDFLIYHRYEQSPGSENDQGLLLAAATWPNDAANLRMMLNDYLGTTAAGGVEIVCTENNSVSTNPGKQSTSLVNGLYYADSVGNLLQTEINAMTWWDLRNGQDTGNNNSAALYGWREYGDYGFLNVDSPYPAYYAMKLLSFLGAGGDRVVSTTSSYPLLSSYSVLRQNGSLSVLVINKSASNVLKGAISLSNYLPASTATVYSYGIPQDNAAKTGTGSTDIAQTSLGNTSASFSYSFPAYSLTIFSFTPKSTAVPTLLSCSPTSIAPGGATSAKLTISSVAPTGGLPVSLSSAGPISVPGSVTVPVGATTVAFTVTGVAVATTTSATITATLDGKSISDTVTVNAPTPLSVTLNPASVTGGTTSTGTVTINGPAPTGGLKVALTSTGSATVLNSVTVAAGAKTATFTVQTSAVAAKSTSTISAAYGVVTKSATLTIIPATLLSLAFSPTSVVGGKPSTLTVSLTGLAPTGGIVVTLTSNRSVDLTLPASVKVPAGSSSVTKSISTNAVHSNANVAVTGSYSSTSRSATLTLMP